MTMPETIRVLVVGCGHMGTSHARAYQNIDGFEIVGLVSRGPQSRERLANELGGDLRLYDDIETALAETSPDAVSINTYPETHAKYASMALEAGAHVFVEKPLAETVEEAEAVIRKATAAGRKLVVGYILQHHPGWSRFVDAARSLGKPLVMRMNLNQQSSGAEWQVHKSLMKSMSPIVDCGVHYVDIMCQMTEARPTRVHAVGVRLTEEIAPDMYNYGHLQVTFDDNSIGWYEAGWGPMMSETAYFVKDVIGPRGSASLVKEHVVASSDVEGHTAADVLLLHHAEMGDDGRLSSPDEVLRSTDEPDHDGLCEREQRFFLKAIREDLDLTQHLTRVVDSLRIVLAADESVRTGRVVHLTGGPSPELA
jgi:predicted dehydrogenase